MKKIVLFTIKWFLLQFCDSSIGIFSIAVTIVGRAITIWEAIKKKNYENYKKESKNKQRNQERKLWYCNIGKNEQSAFCINNFFDFVI